MTRAFLLNLLRLNCPFLTTAHQHCIAFAIMFKVHRAIARALSTTTINTVSRTRVTPAFAKLPSRTFVQCRPQWSDIPTSQEKAATSESTDEVPKESAAASETAIPADQEVAAVSETTDQIQSATSGRPQREAFPQRDTYPVYAGNLQFDITEEQLQEFFGQFGKVVKCYVVKDDRGFSKGYAFVHFENQSAANAAVQEGDQHELAGRRVAIQLTHRRDAAGHRRNENTPQDAGPSKTLFVGNLSYQMSDRDLNDLFRDIKGIVDVRVAISRTSGQPRGFAHADFKDLESAEEALKLLSSKTVYGRNLRVNYSVNPSLTRSSPRA